MNRRRGFVFGMLLSLCILLLVAANLFFGSVDIPAKAVWEILSGGEAEKASWAYIVWESRFPQCVAALLCGAALSVSGLMLQTVFNNPLADSSILGISSGASLGVALIAGIMIGYVVSSVISLLSFFSAADNVQSFVIWGLGNFGGVSFDQLPAFSLCIVAGLVVALLLIKPLNALLLGPRYAENLGVNVRRVRNLLLLSTGILTAVTTAFCGPVAFIGLAVPHIARLLLGTSNHNSLMPVTLLCGSAMALLCNLICALPGESGIIPLNAVTPVLGAPVVIYVIINRRKLQYFN